MLDQIYQELWGMCQRMEVSEGCDGAVGSIRHRHHDCGLCGGFGECVCGEFVVLVRQGQQHLIPCEPWGIGIGTMKRPVLCELSNQLVADVGEL